MKSILRTSAREFVTHDLPFRGGAAGLAFAAIRTSMASPRLSDKARGFKLLMRLHSSAWSPRIDRRVAAIIRSANARERAGTATGLWATYDRSIAGAVDAHRQRSTRIPRARLLVVKSAAPDERGVIIIDYSYVFPLAAGLYDLDKIAERYAIVLEPSWAGSCTPEILLYSRLKRPVFVQTIELRDREFIESLKSNLSVVPTAANWWADPRHAPRPRAARDIDVAMVAAWSDIKRHWRFFRALANLKRRGHRLTAALVGYKYDRTRADIEALATHYGVRDQVTTYERITRTEVSDILARSKIHVLWSRRECANRAIVEAMLADTPVIVRDGLTFGFRYPYINEETGAFVKEDDLADAMLRMIAERDRYRPREWVLGHMTCEHATHVLEEHLQRRAIADGEKWTRSLVIKTSALDTQEYWNPVDGEAFDEDYRFIEACRRR